VVPIILQYRSPVEVRNSRSFGIAIVVVALVAIVLVIVARLNKDSAGAARKPAKPSQGPRPKDAVQPTMAPRQSLRASLGFPSFDSQEIKRVSQTYGFTKEQSDFFASICRSAGVPKPTLVLQSHSSTDQLFNRAYHQLNANSATNAEAERHKTLLFSIREQIENHRRVAKVIKSTRAIEPGQGFTFITRANEQYPSTILDNTPYGMLCAVPRDIFQNEIRMPILAKIQVFFFSKSGQSYKLRTRLLRYEYGKSSTQMLLAHTDKVEALPARRHERKSFETACTFTHVNVQTVVNGRHSEHRFYPTDRSFTGTLADISAGGCSVHTHTPARVGEYIELRFKLSGRQEESAIGKVVKINEVAGRALQAMHVQFAKIPRASMNRIFTFVYNYGDV